MHQQDQFSNNFGGYNFNTAQYSIPSSNSYGLPPSNNVNVAHSNASISFPMPPLSSLGISNLVAPPQISQQLQNESSNVLDYGSSGGVIQSQPVVYHQPPPPPQQQHQHCFTSQSQQATKGKQTETIQMHYRMTR